MAISHHQEQSPFSLLDALYCEEEQFEAEEELQENNNGGNPSLNPLLLLEQDLFWEDEELLSLFSKEKHEICSKLESFDLSLSSIWREKVEWMLKVNAHYGFCALTSVLAVQYFDRFLSSFTLHEDKPWMYQLAAVTCISLAAKVEETHVPLLIDLQVEGAKFVFEAKTIQKMELLVLSTLEWRMNPVTPLSFLDHIIRRLGLKNSLHWEFLRRCEKLLLSVLPDWRFVGCLPSVLAAATMMHAIDQIEPCNPLEYQNLLLGVLNINKEKVDECYHLMEELPPLSRSMNNPNPYSSKRKFDQMMNNNSIFNAVNDDDDDNNNNIIPSSPSGVVDASYYLSGSDSSNDSWVVTSTTESVSIIGSSSSSSSSSSSLSVSSSSMTTDNGGRKRGRVQGLLLPSLSRTSLSRVFVDVGSPR